MLKKVAKRIKRDNENGSRKNVMEELFYDFNRSRTEVYKMNFIRGLFFGLGSVLGGTVVIAIFIWLLNAVGVLVPAVSDFTQDVVQTMDRTVENPR